MLQLTVEQTEIHELAIQLSKRYRAVEFELVQILQKVEHLKIYKRLNKNSLFAYATEILSLDKSVAYALITVARKAIEVPKLLHAMKNDSLTLSKASRIVSTLNQQNADHWLKFATSHTREELDLELAKENPRTLIRDKMKPLSDDLVDLRTGMSRITFDDLKRAQSLEAQKGNNLKWGEVIGKALKCYLEKNDPVQKAKRAAERKELLPARVVRKAKIENSHPTRMPLTAAEKHAVYFKDHGRCTHVDKNGRRCNQDRWLDIHHIIPVSQGGTNQPENLTLLCSFHHDLVHQLSFPIEGQISWLRSPQVAYG